MNWNDQSLFAESFSFSLSRITTIRLNGLKDSKQNIKYFFLVTGFEFHNLMLFCVHVYFVNTIFCQSLLVFIFWTINWEKFSPINGLRQTTTTKLNDRSSQQSCFYFFCVQYSMTMNWKNWAVCQLYYQSLLWLVSPFLLPKFKLVFHFQVHYHHHHFVFSAKLMSPFSIEKTFFKFPFVMIAINRKQEIYSTKQEIIRFFCSCLVGWWWWSFGTDIVFVAVLKREKQNEFCWKNLRPLISVHFFLRSNLIGWFNWNIERSIEPNSNKYNIAILKEWMFSLSLFLFIFVLV